MIILPNGSCRQDIVSMLHVIVPVHVRIQSNVIGKILRGMSSLLCQLSCTATRVIVQKNLHVRLPKEY